MGAPVQTQQGLTGAHAYVHIGILEHDIAFDQHLGLPTQAVGNSSTLLNNKFSEERIG
jgi:hypothetical protein